jgi:hypothetical protein
MYLGQVPTSLAESVLPLLTEEDWYLLDYRSSMVPTVGESSYDSLLIRFSSNYKKNTIANLPIYDKYETAILAYVEWLKTFYEVEDFVCFFARLGPHHKIEMHKDGPIPYLADIHRIHFPIVTNENCFYLFEDGQVHMATHSAYEIDNQRKHGVDNQGDEARIHLVVNVYGERKSL